MKKIVGIMCSAGISASIIIQKLNKYCEDNNLDTVFESIYFNDILNKEYKYILLAPQSSYLFEKVLSVAKTSKVIPISSKAYMENNVAEIYSLIE
ncbi:hypothetical protein NPX79_02915 [Spiroplasma endosymbiont of Anurida maritima]|uniref:hypothetical protein n=1 Tax=Spiroplasma endosymbiont of Anurida maritima TaxID=2967972 RepID=UPI0036D3BA5E